MKPAKSNKFYDRISNFYYFIEPFFKSQNNLLIDKVNSLPKGKLLEIGIGNGKTLEFYKNHKITGIDTSMAMLNKAKMYLRCYEHIELICMNGENLLFKDDRFDYVILPHVIAVVDNPNLLLSEVYRVLKPGGTLIILNHFTPNNFIKYMDRIFNPIAKLLQFQSIFYESELTTLSKFKKIDNISCDVFGYFKLLLFLKL